MRAPARERPDRGPQNVKKSQCFSRVRVRARIEENCPNPENHIDIAKNTRCAAQNRPCSGCLWYDGDRETARGKRAENRAVYRGRLSCGPCFAYILPAGPHRHNRTCPGTGAAAWRENAAQCCRSCGRVCLQPLVRSCKAWGK